MSGNRIDPRGRIEFPRLEACAACGTVMHLAIGEGARDCPLCAKVAAAVTAEREACAKIVSAELAEWNLGGEHYANVTEACNNIAEAIRARK